MAEGSAQVIFPKLRQSFIGETTELSSKTQGSQASGLNMIRFETRHFYYRPRAYIWIVLTILVGYYLISPALASDVTASDITAKDQIEYSGKYSYRCHGIRFDNRVMTDIFLNRDHQWHLRLSSFRFNNIKTTIADLTLYIGRKGVTGKRFPAKRDGWSLQLNIGNNQDFIDRLAATGWLGYQIDGGGQIRRIRIPDARQIIREIETLCKKA